MAKRKSRFIIGLFVTAGVLLGVAAVVWLGASRYFENGVFYLTYFDESVQGLQVDSRVKYRGVDVGKVESIGVAPDRKLVEVLIKIDLAGDVQRGIVTQLRAAGITGIVFVELDRRGKDDQILLPPEGMKTLHPVIPSQPSQAKQMLSSVDRIMDRMEQVDLQGISDQIKATGRTMETFFSGGKMANLMTSLDSTTASLESSLRRIDRILAEGNVEGILKEARDGLSETRQGIAETRQGIAESRQGIVETRQLVAAIRAEIKNLQAGETVGRMNRLMEGLDKRTRRVTSDFESTIEEIRQAVESLHLLLESLRDNPSDLIFSSPRQGNELREGR
jgi:phospholipid/cholesterol/gamma-HCH transport system substrate-binding protein